MAACRCGADIVWVTDGQRRLALDARFTSPRGLGRYRVVEFGPTWLVEPIDEREPVAGHTDHRLNCSALSAAEHARFMAALRGDDDVRKAQAAPPAPPAHDAGAVGPRCSR